MTKDKSALTPNQMLPWYVARSLSAEERRAVDGWLSEHAEAKTEVEVWQQVRSGLLSQPQAVPSLAVKRQIMVRLQADRLARARQVRLARLVGVAIAFAVLLTLWSIVQPGIALEWSVSGNGAQAYRIYRAPTGTNQFELLRELPARQDSADYSFRDISSLPGQTYIYRVEVVAEYGEPIASQTVKGNGLDVLPSQLALIVTSLLAGYAVTYVLAQRSSPRWISRTVAT